MKKLFTILIICFVAILFSEISYSQSIKMNEIFARGVSGNLDWIEIYNSSSTPINIGSYKIYDSGSCNLIRDWMYNFLFEYVLDKKQ